MSSFSSQWRQVMVDCDIFRNNIKVATYKGMINDSKECNFISFDPDVDVQVNDNVFCPLKNKHYIITSTDIALFNGKQHRLDAFFDNNFTPKQATTVFNTYNPNNSIIGSQQTATINIYDSFNNLDKLINDYGATDKEKLFELKDTLKQQLESNQLNKSSLSKFSDLIAKHSWLALAISQIIAAWIQRG